MSDLRLLPDEQEMLGGRQGGSVRRACGTQVQVAEFFGAERFAPITNAHFMGDCEVISEAGLAYLEELAALGARVRVPDGQALERVAQVGPDRDHRAAAGRCKTPRCLASAWWRRMATTYPASDR